MAGRQIIVNSRLNRVVCVSGFYSRVLRCRNLFTTFTEGERRIVTFNIHEALDFIANWKFALRIEKAFALTEATPCNLFSIFDSFPTNRFAIKYE